MADDGKKRCQSCGMPLGEGMYGTRKDGTTEKGYCFLCWQRGKYTNPSLTLQGMIALSVGHMTSDLGLSRMKAEEIAHDVLPKLKRWRKG